MGPPFLGPFLGPSLGPFLGPLLGAFLGTASMRPRRRTAAPMMLCGAGSRRVVTARGAAVLAG